MKQEFIGKINNYINNNSKSLCSLKLVKGYSMYIYYQYKYNLFFSIDENWIKNFYLKCFF